MELPEDVLVLVRAYSKPFTRVDWRTCKTRESELVSSLYKAATQAVWLEEERYEWSLFGLIFLLNLPHRFHHALGRPPLIPPRDENYRGDYNGSYDSIPQYYRDDYIGSYIHHIQWINQ
jgi:hypothetical protein